MEMMHIGALEKHSTEMPEMEKSYMQENIERIKTNVPCNCSKIIYIKISSEW